MTATHKSLALKALGIIMCLLALLKIVGMVAMIAGLIKFKDWLFVIKQFVYAASFAAIGYFLWKKAEKYKA